jgi:Tol biopolymer transport system component
MALRTITPILMTITMLASGPLQSQQYSGNIFDSSGDTGNCGIRGATEFNPETQEYTLSGSGDNIWFSSDQFHFAWKKLKGDFILSADIRFIGDGKHEHRKAGWMIRDRPGSDSPHVSAAVHGDGLSSLQYRCTSGGETDERRSRVVAPDVIQLERRGNLFIFSAAVRGNPFDTVAVRQASLTGEVYAGLFVCSHDNSVTETAIFSNVRITRPAWLGLVPYRDYLGSNLEILDTETGHRRVVFQAPNSIQAPNWTPDGRYLIYNSDGLLYRFDLERGKPEVINSGFATANNNDHVLSFDGKMLGISHHTAEEDNMSIIYIMPSEGIMQAEGHHVVSAPGEGRPEGDARDRGAPERITPQGPSYLHGWSPDGQWLTYTAERNGDYDIYKISIKNKKEIRLTDAPGLDDGSEYSPDGEYIYFNSVRSGAMKLWRMKPDGSEQEQLTFDGYNDWFPHISPDGKWIVFLSFMPDVRADDHPFYKHVYIRKMAIPAPGTNQQDSAIPVPGTGRQDHASQVPGTGRQDNAIPMPGTGRQDSASPVPGTGRQDHASQVPGTGRQEPAAVTPEVIAYLYGGQGTINVPSWSPDGKRVAFVSNNGPVTE